MDLILCRQNEQLLLNEMLPCTASASVLLCLLGTLGDKTGCSRELASIPALCECLYSLGFIHISVI